MIAIETRGRPDGVRAQRAARTIGIAELTPNTAGLVARPSTRRHACWGRPQRCRLPAPSGWSSCSTARRGRRRGRCAESRAPPEGLDSQGRVSLTRTCPEDLLAVWASGGGYNGGGHHGRKRKVSMLIGSHVSVSGGYINGLTYAREVGAECIQSFAKSPRSGRGRSRSTRQLGRSRQCDGVCFGPVSHDTAYLLNLPRQPRARREERRSPRPTSRGSRSLPSRWRRPATLEMISSSSAMTPLPQSEPPAQSEPPTTSRAKSPPQPTPSREHRGGGASFGAEDFAQLSHNHRRNRPTPPDDSASASTPATPSPTGTPVDSPTAGKK